MEDFEKSMLKLFKIFHNPGNESSEAEALELLSQLPNSAEVRAEDKNCHKFTLLHHACYNGWYEVAKVLIEKYTYDPNRDGTGSILLRYACLSGSLDLVRYLIDKECDPNSKTNEELTPLHNTTLRRYLGTKFLTHSKVFEDSSSLTLLHCACQRGHLAVAKYLIREQKCDPSCKSKHGQTPLHFACLMGHLNIAKYLIEEQHIDLCIRDEDGQTPLHSACLKGHLNVAKYLIEKQRCNLICNQNGGWTPLHAACDGGHLSAVEYLIEEQHIDPCIKSEDCQTPLHSACLKGHLDIVKYLTVKQGCDPTCRMKGGWIPLHFACQEGHLHVVKYLIEILRSDPNCENEEGLMPLHLACLNGHINLVIYLIEEQKCNPSCINKSGQTPLHLTCITGYLEVADYLINKWQCDHICKDFSGSSPVTLALKENHLDIVNLIISCRYEKDIQHGSRYLVHAASIIGDFGIVKFLIEEKHYPPQRKDFEGLTPLHLASKYGHIDIVRYLINFKNCSALCKDNDGFVPYLLAIANNRTNVAVFLLQHQYEINEPNLLIHSACKAGHIFNIQYLIKHYHPQIRDENGFAPLHIACEKGYLEIVKLLIKEANCDPNCRTIKGMTPLHLACRHQHFEVVIYLVTECIGDGFPSLPYYGNSLMEETLAGGSDNILFFLMSHGLQFTSKYSQIDGNIRLVQPALKMFILGNSMSGKSTLVKALMLNFVESGRFSKIFNPKVTGVEPHTAGIIPYHAQNPSFGRVVMYDFAGQHEHYSSSHAAILEKLRCAHSDLVFIVVNISRPKEQLVKELKYWDSFVLNQYGQEKPSVIVIGSHFDVAKQQGEQNLSQALSEVSRDHLSTFITLDCTRKLSSGLTEICKQISTHSKHHHEIFNVCAQVHFLNRLLREKFEDKIACQFYEILNLIGHEDNAALRRNSLLPFTTDSLSNQLSKLSEHGEFLYIENSEDIKRSWIIFKKEILLSELNGSIFAPKEFESVYKDLSSTGVVALSKIEEAFPHYNHKMLMSFMNTLDFCHEIDKSDLSIIRNSDYDDQQILGQEQYYFFPALVSTDNNTESCQAITKMSYKFGWCLCCKGNIFFTSRFLQVLLLRLAFSFALPVVSSANEENTITVERRMCNIWKNRIHWQNMNGVETIVEIVEQNTAVILLMGCLKGSQVKCIQLRSAVIKTILSTKEKYSAAVDAEESFLHPDELVSYPLREVQSLFTFALSTLRIAVKERMNALINKIGCRPGMINIDTLLFFEPYTCLTEEVISKLVERSDQDQKFEDLDDDFFNECAKVAHPKMAQLKKILLLPEQDSEYCTATQEHTDQFSGNPTYRCLHIFKTWQKFTPHPTYRGLREALDSFSIFRGRHPLP